MLRKNRVYEENFKRTLVEEFESGKFSVTQLSRSHNIHRSLLYQWIYRYSTVNEKGYRIVESSESSSQKVKELEKKIKELERIVGQKQILADYYKKMIDLAEEQLGIDIKKNSNTPPSGGSESTDKD